MMMTDHQTQCPYCSCEVQVYTGDMDFVKPKRKACVYCYHCGLRAPEVIASTQLEAISKALSVFDRIVFKEASK